MLPLSLPWVHFLCCTAFFGLSLNRTPHIIIKRVTIYGGRRPDLRVNVVAEIFWQLTLGSPAYVLFWKVLLPHQGSSSSHSLDTEQHHLFQALDAGLHVEYVGMWEDEQKRKVNIASDPSKVIMWTGCLVFVKKNINISLDWHSEIWVLAFSTWMLRSTAFTSEISREVNCIRMLISLQTITNWLCFSEEKTRNK